MEKTRPCIVKKRKATFHKWEHKAWVIEPSITAGGHTGGQMELDVAIIEYEDGVVTECYPHELRFNDKSTKPATSEQKGDGEPSE